MTDSDLPARDHNQPPEGILPVLPPTEADEQARAAALAEVSAELPEDQAPAFNLTVFSELQVKTMAFCDAAGAWDRIKQIETPAQSERLTDFVTGARALWKKVEEQRKADKAPWDAGASKVQATYSPLLIKLDAVGKKMKLMQADYLAREQARLDAEKAAEEEAARKAEEEAKQAIDQAAARGDISGEIDAQQSLKTAQQRAKAAGRGRRAQARTATGAGRTMSLRTQKSARIDNARACFAQYKDDPRVLEALRLCANEAIRNGISEADALMAGFSIIEVPVAS
ncbi:hypothetical protein JI664_21580 [Rhodobacter sp. NTK016B]|uniref:hypothetical protein n=1 Tax=Rhodobacter sp. NTK016B TaxID=2759676 RepID=UPI001A90A84D|nr:hypothetical protein [Rhodobacter sp. NTK016B]MBN8294579.1 hypothetical protein [Rhodobacter sp. NTK016B]